MKVLTIISRMNVGGPALLISNLISHSKSKEFEHLLLTGWCDDDEVEYANFRAIDLPIVRVKGLGRRIDLKSDFIAFLEIRRVMKEFNPNIVHTHTAKAGIIGRLASLSLHRRHKRVHTFHGHLLYGYFNKYKTKLIIGFEKFFAYFTDKIITVGSAVRDELLRAGIGDLTKYVVVPPGITFKEVPDRRKACMQLQIPYEDRYVSWIGRLTSIKSPQRVIDIALVCKRLNIDVVFLIAGGGSLKDELMKKSQELNLPIRFIGWTDQVDNILSVSEAVLSTSENEGMSISLIEAQVAGIPVIATDVGSTNEVVMHGVTGFCEKYSSVLFAQRIDTLLSDKELRERMKFNSRELSTKSFSISNMVKQHIEIYENLMRH
jgi:glycosyltransferase involved in cell wall biosynthesis